MLSYEKKIESAISLIRSIPNDGPIELAYSGGKDSDVVLELSRMAGVDVALATVWLKSCKIPNNFLSLLLLWSR